MKSSDKMRIVVCVCLVSMLLPCLPLPAVAVQAPDGTVLPTKGLVVGTLNNRDFPFRPGMSTGDLKHQIEAIVYTASREGYDALFFEARPAGDSFYSSKWYPTSSYWLENEGKFSLFDPLKTLIKEAASRDLPVYVVIDPYYLGGADSAYANKSPARKHSDDCFTLGQLTFLRPESDRARQLNREDVARLFKKYDIAGVILEGIDRFQLTGREGYATALETLITDLSAAAQVAGAHLAIATEGALDTSILGSCDSELLDASLDFVLPQIHGDALTVEEAIRSWSHAFGADRVMPMLSAPSGDLPHVSTASVAEAPFEDQIYLAYQAGVTGYSVGSLRTAMTDRSIDLLPSAQVDMDTMVGDVDLNYSQTLTITRPTSTTSVTTSTYYIFGLSDPDQPLYLDGEAIDRATATGAFGVHVSLAMGANTFTFSQGGQIETISITRYTPSGAVQTSTLSNLSPAYFSLARQNQTMTLTCTAPSGADVTVSAGGVTVVMQPRSSGAAGTPVTYAAALSLPAGTYKAGETLHVGPASYTLSYNGTVTQHTSAGDIYAVAEGVSAAVRITSQNTSIYVDPSQDGIFLGQLKPGTLDFVVDEGGNFAELLSGGYIRKECAEVLTGRPDVVRGIDFVSPLSYGRDDMLVVGGAAGAPYLIEQNSEGVAVTLYNLVGFPSDIPVFSDLFSQIDVTDSHGAVTVVMPYGGEEAAWGVDVYYDGAEAVICVRRKPVLSGVRGRPLEGIVVMLDPGHGGSDPGALGVAGRLGPHEADLNLALSRVAKGRLEALGAEVILTHDGGQDVTLVERMAIAQSVRPDFFISLHHNSMAESSDSGRAFGTEAYYHFDNGKQLAQILVNRVTEATDRYARGAYQSYYIVTKMSAFPSVLLELGFVSNPVEYEQLTSMDDLFTTAGAIVGAIYEMASH